MSENKKIFTGRRKNATARLWIQSGTGKIIVNNRDYQDYFKRKSISLIATQPLAISSLIDKFDIFVNVHGGGLSGQAGAVRHGIAKAIVEYDETKKPIIKKAKMLTRDPRAVERKKYGHKGARRSFQFSKR